MQKCQSGFCHFHSYSSIVNQFQHLYIQFCCISVEFVSPKNLLHKVKIKFVFVQLLSNKVHSKSSNSILLVHANGQIWMNIVSNKLYKDEIKFFNMPWSFRWDEFDWNVTEIEWTEFELVDHLQIWMKHDKIHFEVFAFQPSSDKI